MKKRIAGLIGRSGSGKTTLAAALIRRYVSEGLRVAAIKHTHHPLNEQNRGDTSIFLAAGADPVLLAGTDQAVVFRGNGSTSRISFTAAEKLPDTLEADVILVEGFKNETAWPHLLLDEARRLDVDEASKILDRIWTS